MVNNTLKSQIVGDRCRVLFDIVEGWNEYLNDVLEFLADIPRDVGCFLIPMRVGMNISKMNMYV